MNSHRNDIFLYDIFRDNYRGRMICSEKRIRPAKNAKNAVRSKSIKTVIIGDLPGANETAAKGD